MANQLKKENIDAHICIVFQQYTLLHDLYWKTQLKQKTQKGSKQIQKQSQAVSKVNPNKKNEPQKIQQVNEKVTHNFKKVNKVSNQDKRHQKQEVNTISIPSKTKSDKQDIVHSKANTIANTNIIKQAELKQTKVQKMPVAQSKDEFKVKYKSEIKFKQVEPPPLDLSLNYEKQLKEGTVKHLNSKDQHFKNYLAQSNKNQPSSIYETEVQTTFNVSNILDKEEGLIKSYDLKYDNGQIKEVQYRSETNSSENNQRKEVLVKHLGKQENKKSEYVSKLYTRHPELRNPEENSTAVAIKETNELIKNLTDKYQRELQRQREQMERMRQQTKKKQIELENQKQENLEIKQQLKMQRKLLQQLLNKKN